MITAIYENLFKPISDDESQSRTEDVFRDIQEFEDAVRSLENTSANIGRFVADFERSHAPLPNNYSYWSIYMALNLGGSVYVCVNNLVDRYKQWKAKQTNENLFRPASGDELEARRKSAAEHLKARAVAALKLLEEGDAATARYVACLVGNTILDMRDEHKISKDREKELSSMSFDFFYEKNVFNFLEWVVNTYD